MDFYSKYELIDPLAGEGTRSFRAKQLATGRDVTVHLLVGGATPENEALLARMRALPAPSLKKLIEVGDNEGTTYIVTEAPPFLHMGEWLSDQENAGRNDDLKYTRAGVWKVPAGPGEAPKPAAGAPSAEPGEFTKMFQAAPAPPSEPDMPAPAQAPPPPPASGPGEFTRMFQAAKEAPPPAPDPAPQAPVPPTPSSPPPSSGPGEFTKMFQAAQAPKAEPDMPAPPQSAPPPPASGPGEFTRMFQAAKEAPPPPPDPAPQAPAPAPSSPPPSR